LAGLCRALTPAEQGGLAAIHAKIDRLVEIPAISVALLTGGYMRAPRNWDSLLMATVSLGVAAVVLSSIAASTVHRRLIPCASTTPVRGPTGWSS